VQNKPLRIVITELALDEMMAFEFELEIRSVGLGSKLQEEFSEITFLLGDFPDAGRILGKHNARRMNLRRFPYHLIYCIEDENLVIYAVSHHQRPPDFWHSRFEAGEDQS
jgi:mRNA-degrading endonuclease RelE of RelBE toxin-antitoxin system